MSPCRDRTAETKAILIVEAISMKIGRRFARSGIKYEFLGYASKNLMRVRRLDTGEVTRIPVFESRPTVAAQRSETPDNGNTTIAMEDESVSQEQPSEEDVAFAQAMQPIFSSLEMLEEWWNKELERLSARLNRKIASPEACRRELDAFAAEASKMLDRIVQLWRDLLARYFTERNDRRLKKEAEFLTMNDPYLRQALLDHYILESTAEAEEVQGDSDSDESGET